MSGEDTVGPAPAGLDESEGRRRQKLGPWGWPVAVLGVGLTAFQLYTGLRGPYVSLVQGAIHLGTAFGLIFLLYPARKGRAGAGGVPWYDALLALVGMLASYYVVASYVHLTTEALIFGFSPLDTVVAAVGVLLVLEAARRSVGLPIVVVAGAALAYGYLGPYIPVFGHPGLALGQIAHEMFLGSGAVFGVPIQVSSTYIYLFLLFGVILTRTGVGQFLDDLALRATGRFTGGTAKTAVCASAFQGTISGSSVANTVASGSFTIPMMKRAGFRREFAGATEAAASTGGQVMPPVMGAAAFIMAAITGISYATIIVVAAIPALLYFAGVFFGTHFEAKRRGIVGLPKSELPSLGGLVKRLYMFLPVVVIIGLLLQGRTPTSAALWGIAAAVAAGLARKETRLSVRGVFTVMVEAAKVALPVIAACAAAGIVAGIVTKTGLGSKIAGGLLNLSQGNLILLLFFTMIACLILGMGLPTTANYVVTATVAAPALVKFGVPLIGAHLFVFYFGVVADITPPVCLAAYAGAGIARASPMRTGVVAVKLAIAAFIVPYAFALNPVLVLQGASVGSVVFAVVTALVGMAAIAAGLMGYFVRDAGVVGRLILIAAGIALVYPDIRASLIGAAVVVGVGVLQYLRPTGRQRVAVSPTERGAA